MAHEFSRTDALRTRLGNTCICVMVSAEGDAAVAVVRGNNETKLEVTGKLTKEQVQQLAAALKTNKTLTTLDLYRTSLLLA